MMDQLSPKRFPCLVHDANDEGKNDHFLPGRLDDNILLSS